MGYIQEARENHVKKKVEEGYASKYAQCASGRTLSVVWQCRKQAKELNECLHQYTNDAVLEEMKREYTLQQDAKSPLRA
ncbi:Cytochrome oxidase biogenesis protein [Salix suchowensis]|nr:Cytochrome oxidase biogenesis protein [Salix suchowensis]